MVVMWMRYSPCRALPRHVKQALNGVGNREASHHDAGEFFVIRPADFNDQTLLVREVLVELGREANGEEGVGSGGLAVVVAEHSAKAITAGDVPFRAADSFARHNEIVAEPLMISLGMIMSLKLREGAV